MVEGRFDSGNPILYLGGSCSVPKLNFVECDKPPKVTTSPTSSKKPIYVSLIIFLVEYNNNQFPKSSILSKKTHKKKPLTSNVNSLNSLRCLKVVKEIGGIEGGLAMGKDTPY